MTETVQEEKPKVETIIVKPAAVRQGRGFAGFDVDLSVSLPDLVLRVPVKYEKISSKIVKEKLVIQHRVGNVEVSNKPSPYSDTGLKTAASQSQNLPCRVAKWGWFDSQGKEYPESQIRHFQVLPDGKEQETGS